MTKSKFSAFFPYYFHVFSAFFQLRIFSAFVMRRSAKNLRRKCGNPQRMRRSEVRAILVTRGDFNVFVLVLKPLPVEEVWTRDNFRNKLIVQSLQNEKCSDLKLGLKQTSNLSKWFGYIFPFTFSQNSNVVGGTSPNLRIWRNSWRCGMHVTSENLTCIVVSRKAIGLRLSFIHQEPGW